ncbi:MAG: hypothetical protein ACRCSS_04580, partial [Shewanella sp.]
MARRSKITDLFRATSAGQFLLSIGYCSFVLINLAIKLQMLAVAPHYYRHSKFCMLKDIIII